MVVAKWMKEQQNLPGFADQAAFEAYWKPILFPEILKAKERPAAWTADQTLDRGPWVLGEDVKWNRVYTEAIFPEELWLVRNSGTLLRDWEEAAGWIYLEFEWDHIIELLSGEIELTKIQ
jgi:hypothetical protein